MVVGRGLMDAAAEKRKTTGKKARRREKPEKKTG